MKPSFLIKILIAIGFGCLIQRVVANEVKLSAPTAWWPLNETPADASSPVLQATVGSAATLVDSKTGDRSTEGKFGRAIQFWKKGGHFAYMDAGTEYLPGTGSYTLNLWWNTGSTVTTQGILNNGNWGSSVNGFSVFYHEKKKSIITRIKSGALTDQLVLKIPSVKVNTWYMLTLTVDREKQELRLYHNGEKADETLSLTGYGSLNGPFSLYFGALVDGKTKEIILPSYMRLDEIIIWNSALNNDQITTLFER